MMTRNTAKEKRCPLSYDSTCGKFVIFCTAEDCPKWLDSAIKICKCFPCAEEINRDNPEQCNMCGERYGRCGG